MLIELLLLAGFIGFAGLLTYLTFTTEGPTDV